MMTIVITAFEGTSDGGTGLSRDNAIKSLRPIRSRDGPA